MVQNFKSILNLRKQLWYGYIDNNDRPKVRLYGEKNCEKFVERINSVQWDLIYSEHTDWYNAFITNVKYHYDQSFPLVKVSRKRMKDKPWVSKGIKISIKQNHRLYRASLRSNNTSAVVKYKRYNNVLRRCIKEAEMAYYDRLFQDTKTSSYNMWKHLGAIINPNKKKRISHINKLLYDGNIITDDKLISDSMNSYFCNIGRHLQQLMPNCGKDYIRYLPDRINNTFFLTPTDKEELKNEIKKLNPRKSSGSDNIGARLIQLCPDIFADNLTKIFNNAMAKGEYPTQLKIAKVIALYKKGEKYSPGNYRPISLLSCLNKIFEKILCKRLVKFLELNKILFDFQFGFRRLHSTTLALIEFTDNIRNILDEGNYAISIFIDLTKAFDAVDHEILLDKLDRYGIRGHANSFFRSYLSKRKQYTVINGVDSSICDVKCGVPQGSVLGPLLFALYINDIYMAVGKDNIRLFADDTVLFMCNPNLNTLISDVASKFNDLYLWCIRNKLTINSDKTNFILFHTINKPIPPNLNEIVTNNMTINRVKSFQYLGRTLDETLRFNEHVDFLSRSLIKYFGIFNKVKYRITNKLARELYFTFIYSRIKYGIEVYGRCSAQNTNKIQVMQNKLLKLLLRKHRMTPTDEIHKNMNLLKVSDIYECNVLTFVNDIMMKRCPNSMQQYYQKRRNVYDVRVKNQLIVPPVRICVGDRAVRVAGAALWNNMHKDMIQYRLRKCLKGRLRKHYIAKYHVWCIDWCLFLSVFDTYLPLLVLKIALFYSELSCHFVSYRPGYHVHFYLVVSKMSLVLPWQPPADNNVCFCLVKEYYLYICWKIKILLLLLVRCSRSFSLRLNLN